MRGITHILPPAEWPTRISEYDFALPPELIAQTPPASRGDSRLLVIRREPQGGLPRFEDLSFGDLPALAKSENLQRSKWVRNRTQVFEARLYTKRPTGSEHEIVLVREIGDRRWQCIVRNSKRFDYPQRLHLRDNPEILLSSPEPGVIEFDTSGPSIYEICREYGEMPLPPYIKNRDKARDRDRYQSVWAQQARPQSVAAPTASLHFSDALCTELAACGVNFVDIELDVGLGTFEPLRFDEIHANELHTERFALRAEARGQLESQIRADEPILCVGTTALRCLESLTLGGEASRAAQLVESPDGGWAGETKIFIKPGNSVLYTSQLLTNFHLPQSSLFVLVSTFAGSPTLAREAYDHAVRQGYRFFSYGDATLWL